MVYSLMEIYEQGKTYNAAAIGAFDGVHLGHQKVLSKLPDENSLIIVMLNIKNPLYSEKENLCKIQNFSPNSDILVIPLNETNKQINAETFVSFLNHLKISKIIVGKDYKFGYNRSGDILLLQKSFQVVVIDFHKIDGSKVSTSEIKELVSSGEIPTANKLLGENYSISGTVIKGQKLGRTIDFPTINMEIDVLSPKKGVYKTYVKIGDMIHKSITNVGIRPTVSGEKLIVETHLLEDFNKNLYNIYVTIYFEKFIRPEHKFKNLLELKDQIKKDIISIKE